MKRQEELFYLIHSLDKHEKRFFTLFSSIEQGEKQYMKIFYLIAKQKVYNEKAIADELGMNKNVLAFQKNYLSHLILSRISFLYANKKTELRNMLTEADILNDKGLYSKYHKAIHKAKQFATRYDMTSSLLEISGMEHTLAWRDQNLENASRAIEEKKKAIALLNIEVEYHSLANEIITKLVRFGNAKKTEVVKELKLLVNNPLMRDEKNAITFRCKNWMFHTLSLYNNVVGNFQKQYYFAKKNAEIFLSHPEKIEHYTQIFLFALHNLASACNAVKKYDEAKHYLELISKNSSLLYSEREKIWAFYTFYDNYLEYYIKTGRFKDGIPFAEQLEEELHKYKNKLDTLQNVLLYFLIAKIYFGAENYSKCIEWMTKIRLEEHDLKIRPDLEVITKIFFLIAHYEKGNSELLPYLTKSLTRYLKSKKRLYEFEKVLLNFLQRKIFQIDSKKERAEQFRNLKKELLPLAEHPQEKALLKDFDYLSWVESKIENKTFADVVREKVTQ